MTLALSITAALAAAEFALFARIALRSVRGELIGRTVVIERAGIEVANVRGVVVAEHADRWTLDEAQAVHPEGDIPLEHPVIHIPKTVVLSVSQVPAVRR